MGPKSRTERYRKTKIGTEVGHVTRDSDTMDSQGQKVKGQLAGAGHTVAASRTACCYTLSTARNAGPQGHYTRHCTAVSSSSRKTHAQAKLQIWRHNVAGHYSPRSKCKKCRRLGDNLSNDIRGKPRGADIWRTLITNRKLLISPTQPLFHAPIQGVIYPSNFITAFDVKN